MLLHQLFEPFSKQGPVAVMARAILERLLNPAHLDALFARTAQRQYTQQLLFSTTVDLMAQVVLGRKPSVHAAYQALIDQIPVSDTAVYDKLQRTELAVSSALVRASAAHAGAIIRALGSTDPAWLPGFHCKIVDGSHLEATQHRLAELRTTWAAPLPGKGLVVFDQPTRTVTDILLAEDGQTNERALMPDLLPLVQKKDLWLADSNFCTLGLLAGMALRGARFVMRQHGSIKGQLLGKRRDAGRCETGHVFEQRLRVSDGHGGTWVVRRITIELDQPTTDGDTEIHVLTNLRKREATAATVAQLYRKRWKIEGLFLEVERTLACEINTLAYPKAALFALCVGLLAANAVAVLKAALQAAHGAEKAETLSAYYLVAEIRETYAGMMIALPAPEWQVFAACSDEEMATWLRQTAGQMVLARYRKHPRGPKKKPPRKKPYKNGAHIATAKILAERKSAK